MYTLVLDQLLLQLHPVELDPPEEDDPVVHIELWVQARPQLGVRLASQPVTAGHDRPVLPAVLAVRTGLAGVAPAHVGAVVQHAGLPTILGVLVTDDS